MSDATATETTKAKRGNVEYTLEVVDALPEGGQVNSPFEEFLDKIVGIYNDEATRPQLFDAEGNAKWVIIGRYEKATAAGAAANVLGQRHGKQPSVEGWDFASRRIDNGKTGLFVRFDPTRIVPGAKEQWDNSERARKAKLAAAREAKKAAATNESTGNTPSPAPAPTPEANTGNGDNAEPVPAPAAPIPVPQPTA